MRAVSIGTSTALTLIMASGAVLAQQALPTIEIGGGHRTVVPARPSAAPARTPIVQTPAVPTPVSEYRRIEPRTPTEAYVVRNAETATKTDIPIRQTPASIQVVPKQVLIDQQATSLKDALSNVSNVMSNNLDGIGAIFYLRGFRSNYLFRNSLAIPQTDGTPQLVDTANIERIEVLKGPSSILFGRAEPGGIINIVTKQPLDSPLYRVEQQFGSYDHYRTEWDVSAPIADVPGLAYRVSGAYQNNGSFRQFQGGRRALIAPVIRYSPTPWTELIIDTQFMTSRIQNDLGLPPGSLYGPLLAPLPPWRSFQEANDPKDVNDAMSIGYTFRQNLTEDWKVTNRFLYTESRWSSLQLNGAGLAQDFVTLDRLTNFQDLKGYNFATNIDLNGKFEAFGAKHNFLFGLDYLNNSYDYANHIGASFPTNLYAPSYGLVPDSGFYDAIIGSGGKYHSSAVVSQKGMYIQDYVTWFDRLHLLVGARYDIAQTIRGSSSSGPVYDDDGNLLYVDYSASKALAIDDRLRNAKWEQFSGWSPRLGVTYDILPELSAYASYSRSFGSANGFDINQQALPPERGLQWEIGFKAEPIPGLLATLSFFQITKSNVATAVFGAAQASRLAGLQRSRGIELDVIGKITDRMSILANYALLDAKVIADAPPNRLNPYDFLDPEVYGAGGGFLGNHLEFAPRHSGKLFLTYDFGDNGYGFRLGGGVTASTHWWNDLQNTATLPAYARLDGFASYTIPFYGHKLTAQLNLQNINNARYYEAVDNFFNFWNPPYYRIPARPFQAVGTLRFQW